MICHIDADAFFASVLQRDNPKLRGKPVLALGMSGGTTVIAASYEAKRLGVRTGMRTSEARKLAPDAIAVPADFPATSLASDQLQALMERACPGGVEWASVDEGYLDLSHAVVPPPLGRGRVGVGVSQRRQPPSPPLPPLPQGESVHYEAFAKDLQATVQRSLDLPISVGISMTKTLAKMCSKARKPRGICVVLEEDRGAFLAGLPIDAVPGIGVRLSAKLRAHGFERAIDLAAAPREIVQTLLGKTGVELQAEVQGNQVYSVITIPPPPQSISRCRSFKPTADRRFLEAQVVTHLARCSMKLRAHRMECARVGVWLRWSNGQMVGAERKLGRYVAEEALLLPYAREALEAALNQNSSLFTLHSTLPRFSQTGLLLSDLRPRGPRQVGLFEEARKLERLTVLQETVDRLRERFGRESVAYGWGV